LVSGCHIRDTTDGTIDGTIYVLPFTLQIIEP
jgi:hypothetical protein